MPLRLLVGTCCALETADTERLADLIEAFLASEDQAMRDAFVMGLVRSFGVAPDDYATALQRVRDQVDNREQPRGSLRQLSGRWSMRIGSRCHRPA